MHPHPLSAGLHSAVHMWPCVHVDQQDKTTVQQPSPIRLLLTPLPSRLLLLSPHSFPLSPHHLQSSALHPPPPLSIATSRHTTHNSSGTYLSNTSRLHSNTTTSAEPTTPERGGSFRGGRGRHPNPAFSQTSTCRQTCLAPPEGNPCMPPQRAWRRAV